MIQGVKSYATAVSPQRETFRNRNKTTEEFEALGADTPYELQSGAIFSSIHMETGESIGIYYDESSTESNPVILAKIKRRDGNVNEIKIDVNKIDPKNASYVEMLALSAHLKKEGQIDGPAGTLATMVFESRAKEAQNAGVLEKMDFKSAMDTLLKNTLESGQMDKYVRYLKEVSMYFNWPKSGEH